MAETPASLGDQQRALSRHLRDPAAAAPPGIEERRLRIYRELLHNNIRGLLASNFPVIRKTLGEDPWQALVRDFYASHACRTPLFTEIGREFQRYLEQRAEADPSLPPWLPELAHYEWVELALQISTEPLPEDVDADGDLLDGMPVPSPHAWALAYAWPVHSIAPGRVPERPPPQPTLLLVRRDRDGEVRFALLSPLAYRLLQLLDEAGDRNGREQLLALAREAGVEDADTFLREGAAMLARMRAEGTLLGVRRTG